MKILSEVKILQIDEFVTMRDIDIVIYNCSKYIILDLYIFDSKEIAKLTHQTHIVDNLRAKFLMSMNIFIFEEMILNISRRKLILSLCKNLEMNIRVTSKNSVNQIEKIDQKQINRVILAERLISISAMFIITISMRTKKCLFERDYLFQFISRVLNLKSIDEVMTHIINAHIAAMQIRNVTDKIVIISRKYRLNRIIEYEEHECYHTDLVKTSLAVDST
jgi:hypothetical protein